LRSPEFDHRFAEVVRTSRVVVLSFVLPDRARGAPALLGGRDGRESAVTPHARGGGMTNDNTTTRSSLPHHKLLAYGAAVELLVPVKAANLKDAKLRDEALRAAKSACLNAAEGAGRVTRADKARAFAIARGEAVEAIAAVEIAAATGDASEEAAARCVAIGHR